jgi:hypothetical protein
VLDIILIAILSIVAGTLVFMNLVGPFFVWKEHKLPAIVKFDALEENEFMGNRNEGLGQYNNSLIELGFVVVGSSMLNDGHTDCHFRLYWHSDLKVSAMVATMIGDLEEMTYLEIAQQYTDGSSLNVLNSPIQEAYPRLDFKLTYRYPKIKKAEELLKVHNLLKTRYKSNDRPVSYDISKGFSEVEAFMKKESDALVDKGFAQRDINSDGKRSLTLYGAFALTCRSVPPGRYILGFITERRAEAALRKCVEAVGPV